MEKISDDIYYLKHTENPLSSDSFVIENKIVFDVGNNKSFIPYIENKIIVISHFHLDHIGNINKIKYSSLYVDSDSYQHIHDGNIVTNEIKLDNCTIGLIPNSHSKKALYLLYKNYLFVGDGLYSNNGEYNVSKLNEEIHFLEKLNFEYCIESHDEKMIYSKEEILSKLKSVYSLREKDSPFISNL